VARLWPHGGSPNTWPTSAWQAGGADQGLGVVQLDPVHGLLSFFKVTGPSQEYEYEGKQYTFLAPIRVAGGALAPGVEIDPTPLRSVELRYQNRDEWSPLLRSVVALNAARYGVDAAVVTRAGIQASMRVTLRLAQDKERVREFLGCGRRGVGDPGLRRFRVWLQAQFRHRARLTRNAGLRRPEPCRLNAYHGQM
jgi:hypothetical protein